MQLKFTFRKMEASDSLKAHATERVHRLEKLLEDAGDVEVVLFLERHLHRAEVTLHTGSIVVRGGETSEDMYASIDVAVDKIERQLKRSQEKLKRHHDPSWVHHGSNGEGIAVPEELREDEAEEELAAS